MVFWPVSQFLQLAARIVGEIVLSGLLVATHVGCEPVPARGNPSDARKQNDPQNAFTQLPDAQLTLSDPSAAGGFARQREVDVVISVSPAPSSAASWCLSEAQRTVPQTTGTALACAGGQGETKGGWLRRKPERFKLSARSGQKFVFLWIFDDAGHLAAAPAISSITLDDTAPDAPTVIHVTSPQKGFNVLPAHARRPIITVVAGEPGLEASLYADPECHLLSQKGSSPSPTPAVLVQTRPLADGEYVFRARLRDRAGNWSACSTASASFTLDATPPDPPRGWQVVVGGADAAGGALGASSPARPLMAQITGKNIVGENGSIAQIYADSECTPPAMAMAAVQEERFTIDAIDVAATVVGGARDLRIFGRIQDAAGNVSEGCTDIGIRLPEKDDERSH